MPLIRPFFGAAWAKFTEVNVPVADVGKKIGGKVEANIKSGVFQNACPDLLRYVPLARGSRPWICQVKVRRGRLQPRKRNP